MEDTSSSSEDRPDYSDGGEISSSVAPSRRTTPRTPKTSKPKDDDTTRTPAKHGPPLQPPADVEPSFQPEKKIPTEGAETTLAADLDLNKGPIVPVVETAESKKNSQGPSPRKRSRESRERKEKEETGGRRTEVTIEG